MCQSATGLNQYLPYRQGVQNTVDETDIRMRIDGVRSWEKVNEELQKYE